MREKSLAFCSDGSEYSRELAAGFQGLEIAVLEFDRSEDLKEILDETFIAAVIVSPHVHQARAARTAMKKAGGWASRVPLVAAVKDPEQLTEVGTLRNFDDFVVYPGGAAELVSRIEVLGARRGGEGNVMTIGELTVNVDAHQVVLDGQPVDLTYKEYELLKMLAATPGRAYSREELLRSIWGYDYFGGTRTVDVHIRRLRAKIETSRQYIETVHGVGYRFVAE